VIHGLTVGEWAIVVDLLAGLLVLILGVIGMFWPRRSPSGDVLEVELPFHIKVKSNVMAVGIVVAGIVLLTGGNWAASRDMPKFPLNGRVALDDGQTVSGISVGLIPPEHSAVTAANGTFKVEVPKPRGNESGSYQAVVYYRDRGRLRAEIASVVIDQNWVATIDHRFGR
jgi:hypothetical protein